MPSHEVDVLVVGAGPSGLMAALLLEQQGVSTRIIERRPHPQRAPAAHVVNARTFEICRTAGVDMAAIEQVAQEPDEAGYVYWVTRLGGRALGRLPFEQQGDDQLAVTPTPIRNLSQNHFEPLLLEALARTAKQEPAWSQTCLGCTQHGDGVVTRVRDDRSGDTHEISSRYVIAADGAGSPIRKALGIEVTGPAQIQSFIMVHFHAALRGLSDVPPGVLFFLCDPESGGGVFVVHDLDREAVFMVPFDSENESVDDYSKARCEGMIRGALADPTLDFEIANISTWSMTAQVAERYREGRIFIAGDAAHRFPPTGGLGLNSGVQDVHNLAWKLAAVLKGQAKETLLETYETERRPIAQINADQSLRNALKLIEVILAFDLADPAKATTAQLEANLAKSDVAERVAAAIENQQEHFDMPGLQLGFCYEDGAMVRGAGDQVPPVDVRHFTPCGTPGARVPHAWLVPRSSGESLLERVPLDRHILLAGPEGNAWIEAATALAGHRPVTALRVDETLVEDLDTWLTESGIERTGALLVRPDQHVAWRSPGSSTAPGTTLASVFDALLD